MLFVPNGANDLGAVLSTDTRPASAYGATITPSQTSTYGTPVQVGNDLTADCYGLLINANSISAGGTFRQCVLQILVDYAGGTSWTEIARDIVVSQAPSYQLTGKWLYFPMFIPAGAAVAVAAITNTAGAIRVNIRYMSRPSNPSMVKRGSYIETVGVTIGAAGTVTAPSVTPGTLATKPGWTLLGTTTNRCWWWQFSCQHSDTTMTALYYHVEIGVGDGTAAGTETIIANVLVSTSAAEAFTDIPIMQGIEKVVPAGSSIYGRAWNSGANENAGTFQIAAMGVGG